MRTRSKKDATKENSLTKSSSKKCIEKTSTRRSRRVLTDRTNSDSDRKGSPKNVGTESASSRPKRNNKLPSRFRDHLMSPIKNTVSSSSTPKRGSDDKGSGITCALSPIVERDLPPPRIRLDPNIRWNNATVKPTTANKFSKSKATPVDDTKTRTPIYKKCITDLEDADNGTTPYDFLTDKPTKPSPVKKKRITKQRKKRDLSKKSLEAAMKMFLENVKEIREENMMKKLRAKIKNKNGNANAKTSSSVKVNTIPSIHVERPVEHVSPSHHDYDDHHFNDEQESHVPFPMDSDDRTFLNPIANSTFINRSTDASSRTPWRADLETTVVKQRYNFYVKPSMTPAYERNDSYVFGFSGKKSEEPQNSASDTPVNAPVISQTAGTESKQKRHKLTQTNILSFCKDVSNKSPIKKKSSTSRKSAKICDFDIHQTDVFRGPTTVPGLEDFFGFDDSLEIDQENISSENIRKSEKILLKNRTKKQPVLKEINKQSATPQLETDLFKDILNNNRKDVIETTIEKPQPVKEIIDVTTNTEDSDSSCFEYSSETVEVPSNRGLGLFEDPAEVVHHIKPPQHMYVKRTRGAVKFQNVESLTEEEAESEIEKDVHDDIPNIVRSKRTKKTKKTGPRQMSKKEEKEANEWAEEFNSMLEEAEGFELCIDESTIED